MENIHVLLFYKYVKIENPNKFRISLLKECDEIGLKGRILVAEEGINGSVSGLKNQTEEFKKKLREDERFRDIEFKEDIGVLHPFKKIQIKVKNEIVRFEQEIDLENTGKHISPKEFLEIYEKEGDKIGKEIFVVDARNNYEARVGKFKNAITPNIKTFREFPKILDELRDKKDKKIVMYCTGGIRCEKASAFLKENGFKDVSQLHGGIINFGKQYPDSVWQGKCFVFDKRIVSDINSNSNSVTNCEHCDIKCDLYKNCANNDCDRFFSVCIECEQRFGGTCSETCCDEHQIERQNKVKGKSIRETIREDSIIS